MAVQCPFTCKSTRLPWMEAGVHPLLPNKFKVFGTQSFAGTGWIYRARATASTPAEDTRFTARENYVALHPPQRP